MVHFTISLFNPWTRQTEFKELYQRHWLLEENGHKHLDVGFYRHRGMIFDIGISLTHRQDHAGLSMSFGLLGFYGDVQFYDDRHWNTIDRKWEEHGT